MSSAANSHNPEGGLNSDAGRMGKVGSGPSRNPDAPVDWWHSFVGIGVIAGMLFGLLWSIVMSIAMWQGHGTLGILLGAGAFSGLMFGVLFGLSMAILMRPSMDSLPIGDRNQFWGRLDAVMARFRYRILTQTPNSRTYVPKGPLGSQMTWVTVRAGATEATILGPRMQIKDFKKRILRSRT